MSDGLDPARIALAAAALPPEITGSPVLELTVPGGDRLVAKVDCLNLLRSFKGRGTAWWVDQDSSDGPVVTASAGNFGQGLAWAATRRGRAATVFCSVRANPVKVARMRELGAEVIAVGEDFDAAKEAAAAHASTKGLAFVEDGAEPAIAEGAATIAWELTEAGVAFDRIVVPVGNGALITGIAAWLRSVRPDVEIVGVVARGAPVMAEAFATGRLDAGTSVDTFADGIAVRVSVERAVRDMRRLVDRVVRVGDDEILAAMRLLWSMSGLLTEPAGAAGVAGALGLDPGPRTATVVCGANVDPLVARRVLEG